MLARDLLQDWRNLVDYWLRNRITWAGPLVDGAPVEETCFAAEVEEFLRGFTRIQNFSADDTAVVLDIGAKNFALAPILSKLFRCGNRYPMVHGIEVDAHRRYRSGRTRRAHAKYYEIHVKNCYYHPMDFCAWEESADVILLLNPFVTRAPLRRWGLPRHLFQPERIFAHVARRLKADGLLVISSPTEEERQICAKLVQKVGLSIAESQDWIPDATHLQKQPRLGILAIKPATVQTTSEPR